MGTLEWSQLIGVCCLVLRTFTLDGSPEQGSTAILIYIELLSIKKCKHCSALASST